MRLENARFGIYSNQHNIIMVVYSLFVCLFVFGFVLIGSGSVWALLVKRYICGCSSKK